jgi:D-glycero-D-manno-heptose 1,7-bisphosphate phosphatase
MVKEMEAEGGRVDRVYYCPHRPDEHCACRKPQPGLLEQAATDFGIDLAESYLVGDAWTDIQAGLAVGCKCFLVLTGRGPQQVVQTFRKAEGRFVVVRDLAAAATAIFEAEGCAGEHRENGMSFALPRRAKLDSTGIG